MVASLAFLDISLAIRTETHLFIFSPFVKLLISLAIARGEEPSMILSAAFNTYGLTTAAHDSHC